MTLEKQRIAIAIDPRPFGNIELLAAEIASLVPELARDNPTNRAEVVKNLILREQARAARVHINIKRQPCRRGRKTS